MFIFWVVFIFCHIRISWVWHCSAKQKNLSVAVLSQAPALLVIKSWMSTTGVVFIFSHIKNSWMWHCSARLKIWVWHCATKLLHYWWQCPQGVVGQNRCKKRVVQPIKSLENMSWAQLNKVNKSECCIAQPSSCITCDNVLVISYLYPIIMTS